jgi:Tfp pilus assembly protein PilF
MVEQQIPHVERRRRAGTLVQQGVELFFRGHFEKALVFFDEALEMDPGLVRAYVAKAMCMAQLGDPAAGQRLAEKAIALDDHYGTAYTARALCRRRMGDVKGAVVDYQRALELAPDDFRVYYNFACFCAEQGDEEKCREYLRYAFELSSAGFVEIAAQDPDLARYNRTEWFRDLVAEVKTKAAGG